MSARRLRLGVALSSGAARGWAHVGVLRMLDEAGLRPDVVAGSSVGAIVGAMYALDALPGFERWIRALDRRGIMRLMDFHVSGGGFFEGDYLRARFIEAFGDVTFDELAHPLGIVATNLRTGRERWLRDGSVADGIRASIALPGLFTPAERDGEWLVDGGLVNPVPVSLCHAMGADLVVAVNLNEGLIGRHRAQPDPAPASVDNADADTGWFDRLAAPLRGRAGELLGPLRRSEDPPPALFEVLTSTMYIMQDWVTRSRLAGNPPDLVISPRVGHIGLLEFDRADEAIAAGERAMARSVAGLEEIRELLARGPA